VHLGCGASFGVWDAAPASAAAYAATARGAAQPAGKLSNTMTTNPDGKPYAHNAEQAEAHKLARAEGDGPVSNNTARAYLNAIPADKTAECDQLRAELAAERARLDYVLKNDCPWNDRNEIDEDVKKMSAESKK